MTDTNLHEIFKVCSNGDALTTVELSYKKYILFTGVIYNKDYLVNYYNSTVVEQKLNKLDKLDDILFSIYTKIGFCKLLSIIDGNFSLIITDDDTINIGKDRLNIIKIYFNYSLTSVSFIERNTYFKLVFGAFIMKKNKVMYENYNYIEPTYISLNIRDDFFLNTLKKSIYKIYNNHSLQKIAFIKTNTIGSDLINNIINDDILLINNIEILDGTALAGKNNHVIDDGQIYITDYYFEELFYIKKYTDLSYLNENLPFNIITPFLDRYIIDLYITNEI
jgi:hypothetical protein